MYRILLVDDEENILKALRRLLSTSPICFDGENYRPEIRTFTSPVEALEFARLYPIDLVISDYRMPAMDGVAFLKAFREHQPDAARLILSGYADLNGLIGAINEAQIQRFLSKPWNDYELVTAVAQALAYRRLLLENRELADRQRFEDSRLDPAEAERRRLESESPGITQVNWGPDGSVLLGDDDGGAPR